MVDQELDVFCTSLHAVLSPESPLSLSADTPAQAPARQLFEVNVQLHAAIARMMFKQLQRH
jgi:hypothetical protein